MGLSSETPQTGPRVWGHKIGSAPFAPGLQAPGCSPRASRSRAARPGPPGRGLLAPGLHALCCILPWLIRAEASPCTRKKRVSVSHTASKPSGRGSETYEDSWRSGRHKIPRRPSRIYATSPKTQKVICLNPEKPTNPSSQLRNSLVKTEG